MLSGGRFGIDPGQFIFEGGAKAVVAFPGVDATRFGGDA